MAQRKLIRPDLNEVRDKLPVGLGRRKSPPERTHAECHYYLKQMNHKTPMTVVLVDGEQLEGRIEWYDHDCLKVNREAEPNLVVMKHQIKYLYKSETSSRNGGGKGKARSKGSKKSSRGSK